MDPEEAAKAAAGLAGRALLAKWGWVAGIGFLVGLLLLGILAGGLFSQQNSDVQCGPGLAPPPGVPDPGSSVGAQQVANAQLIDQVAIHYKLPGQATYVALITGLQESSLINLDHGDRDSLGVFQQRPSQGWGTKQQIMDVSFAATSFFFGHGTNRGLTQVPNWQNMDLGAAAQAVQHSAYPQLYDGQQAVARVIAGRAGINLNRAGSATGDNPTAAPAPGGSAPPSQAPPTVGGQCGTGDSGVPSTPGSPFSDGPSGWPALVHNPRSTADAIAWLKAQVGMPGVWQSACLKLAAQAYGWNYAGYTNPPTNSHAWATELYTNLMPKAMRHDGDRHPPVGALLFWKTSAVEGHVAVYLGGGLIASNDISRLGYVDIAPATEIESKWGGHYLGWSPPYFPTAG